MQAQESPRKLKRLQSNLKLIKRKSSQNVNFFSSPTIKEGRGDEASNFTKSATKSPRKSLTKKSSTLRLKKIAKGQVEVKVSSFELAMTSDNSINVLFPEYDHIKEKKYQNLKNIAKLRILESTPGKKNILKHQNIPIFRYAPSRQTMQRMIMRATALPFNFVDFEKDY